MRAAREGTVGGAKALMMVSNVRCGGGDIWCGVEGAAPQRTCRADVDPALQREVFGTGDGQ